MERLKRKLKNRGVKVVELSREEYANKGVALNNTTTSLTSNCTEECGEIANFSAILAVDEGGIFYFVESTLNDYLLLPKGYPSSITVYEKNIFESVEVATFFIQNIIPKNQLPLHIINPAELSNLRRVYIIKN
ncbi:MULTISPECIES: hypothetical protein [Aliiglaciecola]|uniref:hypothetical protein n=1 Tax=Aliiglaciecola TaxID=1406885 RepID=UPI001C094258|nr:MULTISPECIES: hypothetical protein [Aliiglaciecola]MBU2877622.1 hypothetical protein [Aliiglaciecola lipolytica]MDO6711197.1 hypothetical protein [Aliiglaciecola sp. 2_MG-2023]MDO6752111.1 hypothetical protein [Aliiglaciecola sp. 1_MG-2023]